MSHLISRKIIFFHIALIIIMGFAAYANSLTGKFIWDDEYLVANNFYITSFKNLPMIFTKDIGLGAFTQYGSYRPFQMLTYMIDYSVWGLNVTGYHLTNTLLHILVALAVYWLITILFNKRTISFFTAILYVIHPVHTEAVSYISGRADSLAALFMLLSIIFYITQLRANTVFISILMILSYIVAILSRENALILPILLVLYHYVFKSKVKIKPFLTIVSIVFGYIVLRTLVLKSISFPGLNFNILFLRIPGLFVAIINYLRLLFLPFNLHMDYGNAIFHLTDLRAISGLAITSLLILYIFQKRNNNRLVSFSIAWFFINLLPVTNIYPAQISYMAEHWLYLPCMGFALAVASVLYGILNTTKKYRIFTYIFIGIYFSFYFYLTVRQNEYWQVPIRFYEKTAEYSPNKATAYTLLCSGYIDIGNNEKAVQACAKAIQINPHISRVYYNLGNAYSNIGKNEEAIKAYQKEIINDPGFLEAYNNLAAMYTTIGKIDEALALWNKIVRLNPDFVIAYFNLSKFYFSQGHYDLAVTHCNEVIKRGYKVDPKFLKLLEPYQNK